MATLRRWLSRRKTSFMKRVSNVSNFNQNLATWRTSIFLRATLAGTYEIDTSLSVDEFAERLADIYINKLFIYCQSGFFRGVVDTFKQIEQIVKTNPNSDLAIQCDVIFQKLANQRDATCFNRNLLHHAAAKGHLSIVQFLVEKIRCDIFAVDSQFQSTCLHLSSQFGHSKVSKYLISWNQYLLSCRDQKQMTPFEILCSHGDAEMVEFILENSLIPKSNHLECDVEGTGLTPLLIASKKGYTQLVKVLVRHGANMEGRDVQNLGDTCLHLAALHGNTATVEFLIEEKPDLAWQTNDMDFDVFSYAKLAGRHEITTLLQRKLLTISNQN